MINNYKKIKELLNAQKIGPIFFVALNPNRAIGVEKEVKNYHIICSQRTDIVDYLKKEKVPILCLDGDNIKNSGKLLENKKVLSYIKRKSKDKIANIITFKPSPKIAKICFDNGFRYLGNEWELNRKLEDKVEFVRITEKLRISNAKSEIKKIENNKKFQSLFNLKEKYIIQLPRGFSGNSTFLIKNKTDLDKIIKKYKGRKVKVSKYFKGDTYTVNVCAGKLGMTISQPIFQITGLTDHNKNELGTCGNDYMYSEKLKSKEKKKIFNYTKKVGSYMKKMGYRGIFGLDFIVSNGEVNLIEINPRFVASIPVFTKLQIQNKEKPFLLLHILEFTDNSQISLEGDIESKFFDASQLILRNTKNKPIKITKNLKSGIYEIKKDKLIFKKEAYCIDKNLNKNEFLIQCVAKNSVINPDMEYANIQTNYGIMENEKKFKRCFDKIIKSVLENINLSF